MSVAFVAHIGYDDYELADGILKYIPMFRDACRNLQYTTQIYVSVVTEYMHDYIESKVPDAVIVMVPNIGADFLPFIRILPMISQSKYVFKIHTKSNVGWREAITQPIMNSVDKIIMILKLFESDSSIGSIMAELMGLPAESYCTRTRLRDLVLEQKWANSEIEADQLIDQSKFSGGAIYWARVDTLIKAFGNLDLESELELYRNYIPRGPECRLHHWERMQGIAMTKFNQTIHLIPS
jgi:hypothetical protein